MKRYAFVKGNDGTIRRFNVRHIYGARRLYWFDEITGVFISESEYNEISEEDVIRSINRDSIIYLTDGTRITNPGAWPSYPSMIQGNTEHESMKFNVSEIYKVVNTNVDSHTEEETDTVPDLTQYRKYIELILPDLAASKDLWTKNDSDRIAEQAHNIALHLCQLENHITKEDLHEV